MEVTFQLLQITNSIKDNLWLGDVVEVIKLIDTFLKKVNERAKHYIDAAIKLRYKYMELRKKLKEYKGTDFFLNLSIRFNKITQELKISPEDGIVGAILEYLEKLQEKLRIAKEINPITRRDKYKYTIIQNYEFDYETRAIIFGLQTVRINELKETLLKFGFQPRIIAESKSFLSLVAFSEEAYLEMVIFAPRMHIILRVLPGRIENVEKIIERLIESQTY